MIAKKVEEFILETILDQNWPLLLSFICFNLAYVIATKFPLCSFLLCIAGFAFLISVYFGTLSIVSTGRAVLITGCDSGFGNELAKKLNAMGFTVFAGCLDEKSNGAIELNRIGDETGQRLHVVQMDVTKQEEVGKALDYVEKHLPENGLLWGVVNNAGQYGSPGCFEWIPTHVLEKEMSVNLFGAIRVTNAFLPLIRRSQGRIVNVSSIMDRMTSPFSGCYTITKGAIESYSAILRLEMKRFNVQVVVIEPGNFMAATNINKSNAGEDTCQSRRLWDQLDDQIKNDYGEECFQQVISINRKLADISTGEPHTVVDAMANAVSRLYPKNRYFVANMSDKIMAYGMQFLPLWISDRLLLAIINNPVLFDSMQHFKYVVLIPFLAALFWLGAKICNM